MLQQRREQFLMPMTLVVIVIVFIALFLIWNAVVQLSIAPVAETTTVQVEPIAMQQKLVMDTPLVSYTSSLNYNLPLAQRELALDTPLVSLTAGLDYNVPAQNESTWTRRH